MNPVAEKISQRLNEFLRQKNSIQDRIKQLDRDLDSTKHDLHKEEGAALIHATASGHTNSGFQLVEDIRDLAHLRQLLKDKEKEKQDAHLELANLDKQIEHYTFWMRRADTTDEARQKEAEKAIFG